MSKVPKHRSKTGRSTRRKPGSKHRGERNRTPRSVRALTRCRADAGPLWLALHPLQCRATRSAGPEQGPADLRAPSGVGRSNTQAADALVGLLDQLEIPQCSAIAISGGGPTGVALAANYPERVKALVLIAANTHTENRQNDPGYQSQKAFYGPLHGLFWGMLHLFSILSPRRTAMQTLAIFSTHDPRDTIGRLSAGDIRTLSRFFHGQSSRVGALNDLTHTVTRELMQKVLSPTLIIYSREDASIPFRHAEWSLEHIPNARLCESGFTGHFYWIGPDYPRICESMIDFLRTNAVNPGQIPR